MQTRQRSRDRVRLGGFACSTLRALLLSAVVVVLLLPARAATAASVVIAQGEGTAVAPASAAPVQAPDPLFDEDFDAEFEAQQTGYPDPLENVNREILSLNQVLDRWIFKPATRTYRALFPDRVRVALRNFFLNIGSTPILVNDVLQGELVDASTTFARLVLNSVFGVAGFVDAAETMGYHRHEADFGQTLAIYGVGSGPYLVIPLFGPSTIRDSAGTMVDSVMHPTTYVLGPIQRLFYGGSSGLATLDAHYDQLEALQESSVDFYAALRNAYYQSRRSVIWERRGGPPPPWKPYWHESNGRCCRWASCRRWQTSLQSCFQSKR